MRAEIEEIARACAEEARVHILDIKVQTHKNKVIVDISADAERALTIDDYAALSRSIDGKLRESVDDVESDLDRYDLRVGSPGIERPLEYGWQFKKNVGRKLRFVLAENGEERSLEMRLKSVDADTLTFEDGKGNAVAYPANAVRNAVVQIEFS
ncbi:MAG TPA: hypothetical protein VFJ29_03300 [Candidatus Kapabacteria bacterium]|nr:hypothetical protein [Candidatus Kapabacteria bacterium]